MDVTMSITTGGGKKANRVSHAKTLKEVTTFEEAIDDFKKEFSGFFPKYRPLTEEKGKTKKKAGEEEEE